MNIRLKICKTLNISASHRIAGHPKCGNVHGHNFTVKVEVEADSILLSEKEGYLMDFGRLKELIVEKFDHKDLNQILGAPSVTCELLALEIEKMVHEEFTRLWGDKDHIVRVAVYETPDACAVVEARHGHGG